jgi:hypothetical protein
MQRLEDAVAEAKASQAELMRRVQMFEEIAAAAGAELSDQAENGRQPPAADVPRPLMAAAQDPRQDAPVHIDVAGREFIAVVGGEGGDPHEWWAAIQHLGAQPGNGS